MQKDFLLGLVIAVYCLTLVPLLANKDSNDNHYYRNIAQSITTVLSCYITIVGIRTVMRARTSQRPNGPTPEIFWQILIVLCFLSSAFWTMLDVVGVWKDPHFGTISEVIETISRVAIIIESFFQLMVLLACFNNYHTPNQALLGFAIVYDVTWIWLNLYQPQLGVSVLPSAAAFISAAASVSFRIHAILLAIKLTCSHNAIRAHINHVRINGYGTTDPEARPLVAGEGDPHLNNNREVRNDDHGLDLVGSFAIFAMLCIAIGILFSLSNKNKHDIEQMWSFRDCALTLISLLSLGFSMAIAAKIKREWSAPPKLEKEHWLSIALILFFVAVFIFNFAELLGACELAEFSKPSKIVEIISHIGMNTEVAAQFLLFVLHLSFKMKPAPVLFGGLAAYNAMWAILDVLYLFQTGDTVMNQILLKFLEALSIDFRIHGVLLCFRFALGE